MHSSSSMRQVSILDPQHSISEVIPVTPPRTFSKTAFTFSQFEVAGVNLARYGINDDDLEADREKEKVQRRETARFELFEDFDLSFQIKGNESWVDLLRYRRDAAKPSLSFYIDKVARKRWFQSVGVPSTKSLVLRYASELTTTGVLEEEEKAILQLLPAHGGDYAAKSSHLSCSSGVWLIKTVGNTTTTFVGHGKKPLKAMPEFTPAMVAKSLAQDLHKKQELCNNDVAESWALINVKPGLTVEERITAWDEKDDRGGMEFKVFTIWGRMWLAVWRPGVDGVAAFFRRDGSVVKWSNNNNNNNHDNKKQKSHQQPLPGWVDWNRIVQLAEEMGQHKDMFRTDIFVGIPAGAVPAAKGATRAQRQSLIQYVVSETEIHPTPLAHTEEIFDEAGRLWLAGYLIGHFRVVPNSEVPQEFVQSGTIAATKQ